MCILTPTESDVAVVSWVAGENAYGTALDDSGIGVEEVKENHDQTQCMSNHSRLFNNTSHIYLCTFKYSKPKLKRICKHNKFPLTLVSMVIAG